MKSMGADRRVFVTVGTTQFEALIQNVTKSETLAVLCELGYTEIVLQIGKGVYEPPPAEEQDKLPKVSWYRLKDSIQSDVLDADLVISHAGAGSVLDSLNAGKNVLVVINDELMGNHQTELAEKLANEHYLHYCVISDLISSLRTLKWENIKPFPPGNPEKLVNYLDNHFGFT